MGIGVPLLNEAGAPGLSNGGKPVWLDQVEGCECCPQCTTCSCDCCSQVTVTIAGTGDIASGGVDGAYVLTLQFMEGMCYYGCDSCPSGVTVNVGPCILENPTTTGHSPDFINDESGKHVQVTGCPCLNDAVKVISVDFPAATATVVCGTGAGPALMGALGLGDVVEKAINVVTLGTGKKIAKAVATASGRKDCGCKRRKDALNKVMPNVNLLAKAPSVGAVKPQQE